MWWRLSACFTAQEHTFVEYQYCKCQNTGDPCGGSSVRFGVVEGNDRCVAVSNKGSRASFGVCGVLMQL